MTCWLVFSNDKTGIKIGCYFVIWQYLQFVHIQSSQIFHFSESCIGYNTICQQKAPKLLNFQGFDNDKPSGWLIINEIVFFYPKQILEQRQFVCQPLCHL